MTPSKNLTALLDCFEECRLAAYTDGGGVPTIGWGTTVYPDTKARVKLGDVCAQQQADAWRDADIASFTADVNANLAPIIASWDADPVAHQDRFDALCDFAYNCGENNERTSTLLRDVIASDDADAADQFLRWTLDAGRRSNGLLRRRLAERALFLSDFRPDGSLKTESADFPDAQWYS